MSEPPQEVHVAPVSPERLRPVLDHAAWEEFRQGIERALDLFAGRVIWMVNSTGAGGGVAEMLRSFLAYARGAGVDVRWLVITGTPEFFRVTKRLHNHLHGFAGDGGELDEAQRRVYTEVTGANAEHLAALVQPMDIVLAHDPQTAGLVPRLKETGARVVWRSHIGAEQANELVTRAWRFLEPFLTGADAAVFSRRAYVPEWANIVRTEVIQPSIDVFSPKNQDLDDAVVHAILKHVGLAAGPAQRDAAPFFTRQDGTPARVDRCCEILTLGPPPTFGDPLVVQVSRWDRLKDPAGVMAGFARHVAPRTDAHLILAGPAAVADDPESAEVLGEVEADWRALPDARRRRVHLVSIPMEDIDENAAIVNALQRRATVVVQKSIMEGFGLTVAEAMWKSRPVVASAVGGIRDQVQDGVTGYLLDDPGDLELFGAQTMRLLGDPRLAGEMGARGRELVRSRFLANRHALDYIRLFASLTAEGRSPRAAGAST